MLNTSFGDDAVLLSADAVQPTEAGRLGCWGAPSEEMPVNEKTRGRRRNIIDGVNDVARGKTLMMAVPIIDAATMRRLPQSREAIHWRRSFIFVWWTPPVIMTRWSRKSWRCWGKTYSGAFYPSVLRALARERGFMASCAETCHTTSATRISRPVRGGEPRFSGGKVSGNWADLCDSVTDNFRIINPKDFRVMT